MKTEADYLDVILNLSLEDLAIIKHALQDYATMFRKVEMQEEAARVLSTRGRVCDAIEAWIVS